MRRRGIGRVGRPGIVGTAARTAVIAGTATAASGRVASRQAARAQQSAQEQAYVEPPPPPPPQPAPASPTAVTDDVYEQLKKLGELREAGILTDEEFQAKKSQILDI